MLTITQNIPQLVGTTAGWYNSWLVQQLDGTTAGRYNSWLHQAVWANLTHSPPAHVASAAGPAVTLWLS